ncbi:Calcineurin-like phosphoesterase [Caldisphaera lagunensis DSM 15908]|uniref:Calcineurin-like phosphoesterase n=1 Tax=Caldisphaera lagunensis (strain DSM 15908 / JCM 11604 / ANMR 0165 / IC-154) TaxID=1056495 RepID=L0A9J0_CALLD|nr:metallophosphoesterase [Caldisphaera lagunensis]AFZ70536.1 Calcineurin-like phosphoesterase [Caldisphaera lagunensis DSM 15908]
MNVNRKEFLQNLFKTINILEKRPIFEKIESKYPLAIIGDIHGFLDSLDRFKKIAEEVSANKLVFLGDYVDRGHMGVEVLNEIFNLLVDFNDKIVLLRGNHESLDMNMYYGFYEELLSKIGREGLDIINQFYSNLPISIIINDVFFVHGGVPCIDCKNKEDQINLINYFQHLNNIKGKEEYLEFKDNVILQMAWNDPDGSIDWFEPNYMRGDGVYYYGKKAWKKFMEENNVNLIIRGHETVDGFHIWKNDGDFISKIKNNEKFYKDQLYGSVITVFSSRYHLGRAGSIIIYEDEVEFVEL